MYGTSALLYIPIHNTSVIKYAIYITSIDTQEVNDIMDSSTDGEDDTYTNADFEYEIDEDDEVMYCSPNNLDVKAVIIPDTVIIDGET